MATKKKALQAAAGAAGGGPIVIEDVFSTYLYTGNGSTQTITNGIDLAGEGGLVWIKNRPFAQSHVLGNTVNGVPNHLLADTTSANQSWPGLGITSYNSNGFEVTDSGGSYAVNGSGYNFASWTFRKAPRFFDVVTYTGTGSARTISHDLGVVPGCIIVKRTDTTGDWQVYHRSNTAAPETDYLVLNSTAATVDSNTRWNDTAPTDSVFTVGTEATVNASGGTYVAYLFAHDPTEDFRDDIQEYYANGTSISGFYGTGEYRIYVNNSLGNTYYTAGTSSGQVTGLNKFAEIEALIYANTGQLVRTGPLKASGTVDFYSIITQSAPVEGNPDGLIACGSYTGTGSGGTPPVIDLGWEPQWLLVKNANRGGANWLLYDTMRGLGADGSNLGPKELRPNSSAAEFDWGQSNYDLFTVNPTGFTVGPTDLFNVNNYLDETYIYIAIRRGPMRQPTSGTEVFSPNKTTSNQFVNTGFPVDLQIGQYTAGSVNYVVDRLRGMSTSTTGEIRVLTTQTTGAEFTDNGGIGFNGFVQDGFSHTLGNFPQALWSFRRAPGFFDVVAYTGDGTAGRTVPHNLGVAPELMIVKKRSAVDNWVVYAGDATDYLILNSTAATADLNTMWNDTAPTSSVFSLGTNDDVNGNTATFIAYLFATLPGVSKVGSYTGNGSSQTIDCGFTSGARFVLIKRTDSTGDWYVWDTARGIVTGNDPYLSLNTNAAEVTTNDSVDPDSSGFIVNEVAATNINVSSASYIFLAIA